MSFSMKPDDRIMGGNPGEILPDSLKRPDPTIGMPQQSSMPAGTRPAIVYDALLVNNGGPQGMRPIDPAYSRQIIQSHGGPVPRQRGVDILVDVNTPRTTGFPK